MPLQQGEVRGYDFNRSVVEFTMLNQSNVILCAVSTAAMDDLEGRHDVKSDQRVDQFMRLREVIEERASRKFFEEQAQSDRPVVLRANDFWSASRDPQVRDLQFPSFRSHPPSRFHRDVYDEDGLRLGATMPSATPAEAFAEARKIVDNRVEGPRK